MKLSTQGIAAIMIALQKGLIELVDITGILEDFEFIAEEQADAKGHVETFLFVENPPQLVIEDDEEG